MLISPGRAIITQYIYLTRLDHNVGECGDYSVGPPIQKAIDVAGRKETDLKLNNTSKPQLELWMFGGVEVIFN